MKNYVVINHISVCKGDMICPRCGRRMCKNCVTTDRPGTVRHNPGHYGESYYGPHNGHKVISVQYTVQ